ncbi:MAG: hypothetical protein K5Q68_14445 [Roseococcus sp.]|nr:hypothetical protein [Roseococcus sp.]
MLTRRHALGLGLLPFSAQAACAPDFARLTLEGTGAPAGSIAVLGQAFRPGDMPRGSQPAIRLASGAALPTQMDVRSRHPDGSVRLAQIAIACPALADGALAACQMRAEAREAGAALELPRAGRSAHIEIQSGGQVWRADLLQGFPGADLWQSGPLAIQGRVARPVPLGGIASLRLVADVALRADGTLWVEAWLRNDVAMRPNGGEVAYAVRLRLDGRVALEAEIRRQHQYTGWGRLLGSTQSGPAPQPPLIRHDAGYLADAGAVARYGLTAGIEPALLARMAGAMAAPGWSAPLGPRGITQDMRQTGGRADIGPATMPQAAWLISGDRRAAGFALGQAEAAGSIPWHFFDSARGAWMDTIRWPGLWTDGRGGPAPGGLAQPISAETGWVTDSAHQPDLSFIPYLLTGRRALLDNLQAQAAWAVLSQWPAAAARGAGEGVNVVRGNQVRGAAWSLRQLENAAWASPDADRHRPWLRASADANWAWITSRIPAWTAEQGEAHGRIPGEYGTPGVMPPWQQDYFASTAAIAAQRGDPQARAVLGWMTNFLVGRFKAEARGFPPRDGCAYLIATGRSWAEIGAATRAAGLSNGTGWSKTEGDYAQLALQSLAAIIDVLDLPAARSAHAWLAAAGAPFTRPQDFRRDPIFHIVPRAAPPCRN